MIEDPSATSSSGLLTKKKGERTSLLSGARASGTNNGLSTSDSDGLSDGAIAVVDTIPHADGRNGLKEEVKSPAKKSAGKGQLIADEERVQGKVSWFVFSCCC
jgi:hypothetical protein